MVTTNLIEEKGFSSSLESTFRGAGSGREDNNVAIANLILKPSPKPLLKVRSNGPAVVTTDKRMKEADEREKVIDSLGEVLDKAEKLETSTPRTLVDSNSNKPPILVKDRRPANTAPATAAVRKLKTLKSVWRKGNPVASVQRVVKEVPKEVEKEKEGEEKLDQSYSAAQVKKLDAPLLTPSRPRVPSPPKPSPRSQAKPVVAPPSQPQSVAKKPIPVKDRKPILIDKFAVKNPIVDLIAAEAVLSPTKPAKGSPPSKVKEERRKKTSALGGLRKRLVDDAEMPDALELDVPIPGIAAARKGRKWSKASRKAARLQAAKAAEPVKVEILEVGEEGMLPEELAYNLEISESEILGYLFSMGVRPDEVRTLDKDMVKMICAEYGVEVIEGEPAKVEEMARKKEVLDEEGLNMLEDRPPVITIMGHADHGKVLLFPLVVFLFGCMV